MTEATELQPAEQELEALFRERAAAVAVQSLPPIPEVGQNDSASTQRGRFWLAIAAAVALLAGAGWTLLDSTAQPTEVEVADSAAPDEDDGEADDGDDLDVAPAERPVFNGEELAAADPGTAAEVAALLDGWSIERPIIVVTGAEWCPHCQADLPSLIPQLHFVTHANEPVPILGISAKGDTIWEQVDWPFQVLEISGSRDRVIHLMPPGLDGYPMVAVWSIDGMVGESRAANGLTLQDLQEMVAAVPLDSE